MPTLYQASDYYMDQNTFDFYAYYRTIDSTAIYKINIEKLKDIMEKMSMNETQVFNHDTFFPICSEYVGNFYSIAENIKNRILKYTSKIYHKNENT